MRRLSLLANSLVVVAMALLGTDCSNRSAEAELAIDRDGPMGLVEARAYLVELVNRDREEHGVPPVKLDAVATRAAQRHAEDMASHGFTAHFGTDGSVPEQRYTEAGGPHLVQENAFCVVDGKERPLERNPGSIGPRGLRRLAVSR